MLKDNHFKGKGYRCGRDDLRLPGRRGCTPRQGRQDRQRGMDPLRIRPAHGDLGPIWATKQFSVKTKNTSPLFIFGSLQ